MIVLFTLLSLKNDWLYDYKWQVFTPSIAILCWLGGWLHLLAFHDRNSREACYDLIKIAFMVGIVFGIIVGVAYFISKSLGGGNGSSGNHNRRTRLDSYDSNSDDDDDTDTYTTDLIDNNINIFVETRLGGLFPVTISTDAFSIVLGSLFVVVLVCIEWRAMYLWKSIKIRYHWFGIQLIACIDLVMVFCIYDIVLVLLLSLVLVLYNTAILWNDMMHKRLMAHLTMQQYTEKYRPVVTPINLCCQCFNPKPKLLNSMDWYRQPTTSHSHSHTHSHTHSHSGNHRGATPSHSHSRNSRNKQHNNKENSKNSKNSKRSNNNSNSNINSKNSREHSRKHSTSFSTVSNNYYNDNYFNNNNQTGQYSDEMCCCAKCCVSYCCCCFRERHGCFGGWVCQIYGGLLLGRISNADYSIYCDS